MPRSWPSGAHLAFKISGYSVADDVDEFGQFVLDRDFGALEVCRAMFVFLSNGGISPILNPVLVASAKQ